MRESEIIELTKKAVKGGQVVMTAGVAALPQGMKADVLAKVRSFNDFNPENDPYREHDFGGFEVNGDQFIRKIDYYDERMKWG